MATTESKSVPERRDVPVEETCRIEDLYPGREAWEAAMADVRDRVDAFVRFRGHLGDSPQALLEALRAEDEIGRRLERIFVWAMLRHDHDTRDAEGLELLERAQTLVAQAQEAGAFVRPELVGLPEGRLDGFLEADPALESYRRTVTEILRRKRHVLAPEVEGVLSAFGPVLSGASRTAEQLGDADLDLGQVADAKGAPHPLTHGRYPELMSSADRELRKNAYLAMQGAFRAHGNTFAATLGQSVKRDAIEARLRGYPTALAMGLDERSLPDAIYGKLLEGVAAALPDLQRYVAWRRRRLGVEAMHFYDLYPPIARAAERRFSWDEAVELIVGAMRPLGPVYGERLRRLLTDRSVDRAESRGKRSGAYSVDVYDVHPYILMSYTGTLESVFTLAHEAGHSLHAMFAAEKQNYRNAQYEIFLAEIASTVNEQFLLHHLLASTPEGPERLDLLDKGARNYLSTVFRQTLFADFEQRIHRQVQDGGALTPDALAGLYGDLLRRYYGPGLQIDEVGTFEWARIPHFYRAFYVFQYATGFIAASAIREQVAREGEPAARRYIELLSAGGSDDPLPILERAGVDLMGDGIKRGLETFSRLVDELEAHP